MTRVSFSFYSTEDFLQLPRPPYYIVYLVHCLTEKVHIVPQSDMEDDMKVSICGKLIKKIFSNNDLTKTVLDHGAPAVMARQLPQRSRSARQDLTIFRKSSNAIKFPSCFP